MYRLLIVDDEEIEREGMANFIQWDQYGIELVGTAWNGAEGLEKIRNLQPDIVFTDIKMPIMDGIELIKRCREEYPGVEFIVLSGYGEYEFTSQAMEEGVRHYLLKPYDDEQIEEVLDKVKAEIQKKREQQQIEKEYKSTVYRLMSKAREQVFRDLLLNKELNGEHYRLFMKEYDQGANWFVLAFYTKDGFDHLEQFVLNNVLCELVSEENVSLSTSIQGEVFFLISETIRKDMDGVVGRIKLEFGRISTKPVAAAASELGTVEQISDMYSQIRELFLMGLEENHQNLLHYGMFREQYDNISGLIAYGKIRETEDWGELLFEVYLIFEKMSLRSYSFQQKEETARWILKVLYGISWNFTFDAEEETEREWKLLIQLVEALAAEKGIQAGEAEGKNKEEQRIREILFAVFHYLKKQELSVQFLAKEVLYMNEDYLSRFFFRNRKIRFSTYLLEQRICLAQRLFQYDPELKVSSVAELSGYSPDGQYFSKAFRKITGMTPTEYKEKMTEEKEKEPAF